MRHLLIALFLLVPGLGHAQSVQDQIVTQLTTQGFTRIEVSRTLLGRVKIEARSDSLDRELVFNPSTGEILRDYWRARGDDDDSNRPRVLIPQVSDRNDDRDERGGSIVGSSGKDRDDDDKAEDDARSDRSGNDDDLTDRSDDDRSGSGGGGDDDDDDDREDDREDD